MNRQKPYILALDLGGTRYRLALADAQGRILKQRSELTQVENGRDHIIRRISHTAYEILEGVGLEQVRGMGIAAPGPIDPETGVIHDPPNLPGWDETPLKTISEQEFRIPVWVGNDANLGALGEHRYGAGRGSRHMVYVTVGTGVGGGIIIDGELFLGAWGMAGEVGHIVVEPGGPQCGCGARGCLEALASGPAIARLARERLARGERSAILELVKGDLEAITCQDVEAAARAGDALAGDVFNTGATHLGLGIVALVHILNPGMVVIGGGVAQAGELLLSPVRKVVAERVMPSFRPVAIVASALEDNAGLLGAVALVLDKT